MKIKPATFVLRSADKEFRVLEIVIGHIKRCLALADDVEVVVRQVSQKRTDKQLKTLFMWHTEVASELTIRTRHRWTKELVHDVVFIDRWMPKIAVYFPDGSVTYRSMRTSEEPPDYETRTTRQIIADAMDQYLAWCYSMEIEVTVPESDWHSG